MKVISSVFALLALSTAAQAVSTKASITEIDKASSALHIKDLNQAINLLAKRREAVVRVEAEKFLRDAVLRNKLPQRLRFGGQFESQEAEEKILRNWRYRKLEIYNDDGVYIGHIYYSPFEHSAELMHGNSRFISIEVPFEGKLLEDNRYSVSNFQASWYENRVGLKDGFEFHEHPGWHSDQLKN